MIPLVAPSTVPVAVLQALSSNCVINIEANTKLRFIVQLITNNKSTPFLNLDQKKLTFYLNLFRNKYTMKKMRKFHLVSKYANYSS